MVAIVIPCFRVKKHILDVISRIGPEAGLIYVVDDRCPESSGSHVMENCKDPRVRVVFNESNLGVGGAVIAGYRRALQDGADIVVKIDGDNQMDPALLKFFIRPISEGLADYTKGNRFFDLQYLASMPGLRLFGNSVLSLVNKVSSGYWDIMDPTNGYTAIHRQVLQLLQLDKIDPGYFFESDMLFRLNILRAVVRDIPMKSTYQDEKSSMRISRIAVKFPFKYVRNFCKRIFYNYFLRDFNAGTVQILLGSLFTLYGTIYGGIHWLTAGQTGVPAAIGIVMQATLPIILGFQLLVSAVNFDITSTPKEPVHNLLEIAERPSERV